MDCTLKNLALNFQFSYRSSRQTQKCIMDYSSCKKLIDVLVLNFKAMFSAGVKVRKKHFCIVLTGKQQKCHDRAPLKGHRQPQVFAGV